MGSPNPLIFFVEILSKLFPILAGRDSPHGARVLQSGEVLLALLRAHWPETVSSRAGVGGGL